MREVPGHLDAPAHHGGKPCYDGELVFIGRSGDLFMYRCSLCKCVFWFPEEQS